jgi:hypothetical protein
VLNTIQFASTVGSRARSQATYGGGRFNGRAPSDRGFGTGRSPFDQGIGTGVNPQADSTSNWADFGETDDVWQRLSGGG